MQTRIEIDDFEMMNKKKYFEQYDAFVSLGSRDGKITKIANTNLRPCHQKNQQS